MRLRRPGVGVLILALAAACAAAAQTTAPPAFDELLQLLAARRHGHVTFTEMQHLAMLDRPLESSGELLYDAPDRLEKRTLKPKAQTLILEHGVLTARRGHRTHVMELRDYPQVVPFVESIRATLAGDRAALERLDRPGPLPEHLGGSLDRKVGDDSQQDRRPLIRREPVEGRDRLGGVPGEQGGGRAGRLPAHLKGQVGPDLEPDHARVLAGSAA